MSAVHLTARAILTDIEGTTSSISFVKEVLFPYAAEKLPDWLAQHWHEAAVQQQITALAEAEHCDKLDAVQASRILRQWIAEDRKATPLKTLQGMIWQAGYEHGDYQAHLYPDVPNRLRQWHQQGLALYVYSSGSIAAQKLFFGYSEAGDLTPLFSGYFDTTTGPKKETGSYDKIVQAVGEPASDIVFLSDITAELDAARSAGMQTVLLDRAHQSPPCDHPAVDSFADIHIKK